VLVDRVIAGFDDAFDELYRRHANAAWRLGQAVTGNSHDAADAVSEAFARVLQAVRAGRLEDGEAFRSYLLTATRHAALDGIRRGGRTRGAGDDELSTVAAAGPGPVEKLTGAEDAGLVAEAFRGLPERWRSVLWLTEVEGIATKDAADQLGLTPNGTAQLAVRARAGLRERFLQAHVKAESAPACRFTVEHLGAYVGGGISPRDLAKVDQHLADCEACRARKDELEDVGTSLRRAVLPIPLALGALSAQKVLAVLASSSTTGSSGLARVVQLAKEPTPMMRRVAGASAATVLALGLLALGLAHQDDPGTPTMAAPRQTITTASAEAPVGTLDDAMLSFAWASNTGSAAVAAAPSAPTHPGGAPTAGVPSARPTSPTPSGSAADSGSPAATSPLPAAVCTIVAALCPAQGSDSPPLAVGLGANVADHEAGVRVNLAPVPSVSVTVDDTTVGSPTAPTPSAPGVTLQAGPVSQTVPVPGL
jgi:RNA polymerase sigma factor (sigma-70 family)